MEHKKRLGAVVFLLVLLIVPVVLGLGLSNVPGLRLFGGAGPSGTLSTADVFVDPAKFFKDYTLQPIGSTFILNVSISGVTDLFSWQINMTWNPSILNVNTVISGTFLNQTTSANKTSSAPAYFGGLGAVINVVNNTNGCVLMCETILEDALPGDVTGVSGGGRLVSVEFLVVGYGSTFINMTLTGAFRTTLLDSLGAEIVPITADGYFSNRIAGDIDGDQDVDRFDFGYFAGAYGSSLGGPSYDIEADLDKDDDVDRFDFGTFAGNYGRSV